MKRKLIYIMGHSRSGSTIFDIMLSNSKGVVGVGELTNLEKNGWQNDEYCSCGKKVNSCDYWSNVKSMVDNDSFGGIEGIIKLKASVEGRKELLNSYIKKNQADCIIESYKEYNSMLLDSISKLAESDVIVDSSKLPSRALFLSLLDDFDVYILHIVRDPRAVCWSLAKPYKKDISSGVQRDMLGKPIIRTIRSWLGNAILSMRVKRHAKAKYLLVNYDRLIKNTKDVLAEISNLTDHDFSDVFKMISADQEFSTFHTVAGNRLRMAEKIKLSYDDSWKKNLSYFEKALVTTLTLPFLKKFGFRVFG